VFLLTHKRGAPISGREEVESAYDSRAATERGIKNTKTGGPHSSRARQVVRPKKGEGRSCPGQVRWEGGHGVWPGREFSGRCYIRKNKEGLAA